MSLKPYIRGHHRLISKKKFRKRPDAPLHMQQTQQSDPFFETPLKPEVIEAKVEAETSLWKREGNIVAEQEIKEKRG